MIVARMRLHTFRVVSTEPETANELSPEIARHVTGPECPTKLSAKSQISRFQDLSNPSALPGVETSLDIRKPVFGVSDQAQQNPGCTITDDC